MGNSKLDNNPKKLSEIADRYAKLRTRKQKNTILQSSPTTAGAKESQPGNDGNIIEVTNRAATNKIAKNSTGYCFVCKQSFAYEGGYHFFLFPWKNPDLLQRWFKSLGLEGKPQSLQPTYYSRICSQHFPDSAIRSCGKVIRLQDSAVPRLLPINGQPETISQPQLVNGNLLIIINPAPALSLAAPHLIPYNPNANGIVYRAIKPKETPNPVSSAVIESCQVLQKETVVKTENMDLTEDNVQGEFVNMAAVHREENSGTPNIPDPIVKSEPPDPVHEDEYCNWPGDNDITSAVVKVELVDSDITGESPGELGNWDPLETRESNTWEDDGVDGDDASEPDHDQTTVTSNKPSRIRRNRLYPASCTPNDADSPAVMKKKLAILFKAYHDLKRRKKTALQAALRLRKENEALKKKLEKYQQDL